MKTTASETPRYSVTKRGKVFQVFDRKRRRIVTRTATIEEANRIRAEKEKTDP